jgi:phage gp46-like protein
VLVADLALVWTDGTLDLVIEDDDVLTDDGLRTAVLISLFTDRRAEADDELPSPDGDRRGSWTDEFEPNEGDRIGSRGWLLGRAKRTADIVPRAEAYAREALAWMVADRVCERIDIDAAVAGQKLTLAITIHRPKSAAVTFRFGHTWDAEAARAV